MCEQVFRQKEMLRVWNTVELDQLGYTAKEGVEWYRSKFHPAVKPEHLVGIKTVENGGQAVVILQKVQGVRAGGLMFDDHDKMREYNRKPLSERADNIALVEPAQ